MASSPLILLAALLAAASPLSAAQKTKPVAPGPSSDGPPTNLTSMLEKDGHYKTFLRFLKESRVDTQINSQLYDSYNGLTVFAPTDAAFDKAKPGMFNNLSPQDQIQMMLYLILPRFYSLNMFNTISNPVNTQASDKSGPFQMHISTKSNAVNVSTGVNYAVLSTVVSKEFPLAVYSIDNLLLPYELFGPKPPAPAPAPAKAKSKSKKPKKSEGIAEPPVADAEADSGKSAAAGAAVARWVAGLGMLGAVLVGGLF